MLRAVILSTATSLGLAATVAVAHAGEPSEDFTKMDNNADGFVSASEFLAHMTASGNATEAEILAWFDKHAGEDGLLSPAEYEAADNDKAEPTAES